jgi:hypothetical protein
MHDIIHYINNKPISIYNIYKYLINLYKLDVIPLFKVEIHNKLTEAVFTFNYDNEKHSTIIYNTDSELWTIITNVQTIDEIYNNKYYSYLFNNQMIGYNNNMFIFQSYEINDILELAFTSFNSLNNIDIYNLYDIDDKKINNLDYRHYYMFINNLYSNDRKIVFDKYKENINYMPNELWDNIYSYYKFDNLNFNEFVNNFL